MRISRILCSLILLALLLSAVLPALAAPPSQASLSVSFTLADLGEKNLLIKSVYDQAQVHFPLAEGRQIEHAVLWLHFSHGKKLLPELSDLTVAINDEPVANILLTPENADENTLALELPPEALRSGDNVLSFRFHLRLRDSGCGDAESPSLWARIFADSSIELTGSERAIKPNLGRFPAPFTTLSRLPGNPALTLVLPTKPTDAELTAAAQIAASLGQAAQWEQPPLWMVTADGLDPQRAAADHLIVIDTAGRNPLAAGEAAGLTEQVSPYNPNRLMLVVSGLDDATLLQSAALLATQSAHSLLLGTQVAAAPVAAQPWAEAPTRATFTELGFDTRRVRGIGSHDLYYPLDIPYDWKITSDANLELRFSHAGALANTSHMLAFINGFQVANVELNNRNDADGRLVIQLSPRQIHPGRNWLHLAYGLHLRGEDCNFRYMDEAWAEVSAEQSVANLAHVGSQPPLDLHYLPSPLVTPADLSADVFVLSAQPEEAELTALARLAAKLGTYSNADGLRPQVTTAERFIEGQAGHVIAIGVFGSNALLAEYDNALPQPLALVNGAIEPAVGRELLPEEVSGAVGYLQMLPAPWSRDVTLMVLSAPSADLLLRTVDILPVMGQRLRTQGNVAVVMSDKVIGMGIGNLAGAPLSDTARLALSAVLIGAFASIGAIGMILTRRQHNHQQEAKHADQ